MPGLLDRVARFFALSGSSRAAQVGSIVKPTPNPVERDYLTERIDPGRKPSMKRFRDLPVISSTTFDDVDVVRGALTSHELGQFWHVAQLVDAFGVDDRISGVVQTRIDALFGLPIEVSSRTGKPRADKIAERAQTEWGDWFASAELRKLLKWALHLRVAVAEIIWDTTDGTYWAPRLKTWDPRYLYWRWDTRSFWLITMDGPVEVTPGDGHWVLYCPDGYSRGWMNGYVRSLALLFLIRRWAIRDWARYSEVHGLPIKKAKVPAGLPPEDKENFLSDLETLGSEGLVRLAVDEQGAGFDLTLLEAASQSWEGFERLLSKADECIAVDVLGQNLTTSVKGGGSYAAANVHDRIRMDRVESDSRSLGDCLSEQVLVPWAIYNFGDVVLAPRAKWSTKIEEQRSVTAETWVKLGDALQKITAARQRTPKGKSLALNLDLIAIATQFRLPIVSGDPLVEAPEPSPPPAPVKADPKADPTKPETSNPSDPEKQDASPEDPDSDPE